MQSLVSTKKLHAKSVCISAQSKHFYLCSSANLTAAASGVNSTNFEAGIAVVPKGRAATTFLATYDAWYRQLWTCSIPVTPTLIDQYSHLRRNLVANHPFLLSQMDDHPESLIGQREHLWIEAGSMSGGDRNQVEFGPMLARFFGPPSNGSVLKRLKWHNTLREDRPLSHKVTKWGTDIWRFSLITSRQGGPSYPGQVIHFTRRQDSEGEYFDLDVEAPGASTSTQWHTLADRHGTRAATGAGGEGTREYGIY
jgi:hypothetical protein